MLHWLYLWGKGEGSREGHSLNFCNNSLCVLTVITSFSSQFDVGIAIIFPILWIRNPRLIESSDLLKNMQLLRAGVEKAMAPHSSTLAWRVPWMEEPGRLQSMGSLRVRHD